MSQVFISYTPEDQAFARQIARDLNAAHLNVWLDVNSFVGGKDWDDAIEDALEVSDFVLLLVSSDSMKSRYVTAQWEQALEEGKLIIPVLVQPITSDKIHFRLARFQYVDATQPAKYDLALKQVIELVQEQLPVRISPEQARTQRFFVDELADKGH
ncbi:MAG: toll/interleukin-1 receptor domain-containing protein [Burkholderiales bacterium]|nr:toll/interleukin-1 receptor domain-containing protein [Anaerolineae bacterium]